jgi:hypothetical protein
MMMPVAFNGQKESREKSAWGYWWKKNGKSAEKGVWLVLVLPGSTGQTSESW